MKDKWLKDLHDRMSEFKMDTPDNLWAEIEKAEKSRTSPKYRPLITWIKRASAAAAIIAVISAYFIHFNTPDLRVNRSIADNNINTSVMDMTEKISNSEDNPIIPPSKNTKTSTKATTFNNMAANTTALSIKEYFSLTSDSIPTAKNEDQTESQTSIDTAINTRTNICDTRNDYPSTKAEHNLIASNRMQKKSRTSIGVYSSGGINTNFNNRSISANGLAAGPDGARWDDRPLLGILLFNQGNEIDTEIKHRHPIRAGISFTYKHTDRLGISTGLSYTNLTSDFKSGSKSHYFIGEQTLHYIGIPLNVTYDIFTWKRLQVYGSAGILGEKCVYGKTTTDYILNETNGGNDRKKIEKKPFQFSVNASAGIQFNLTNAIGFYAEPGVSYYFNDGTDIKTIYKDKPLNFNLNLGLRFSIK